MTTQQERLSAKFDESVHRSMLKGGTRLTYIPVAAVIQRLNEVLGVDAWSLKIVSTYRDATDPDFIVAHIMLTAEFEREVVTRDAVGGQRIKRTRDGGIIDLGDEMKGAVSDALKKAAQTLGVGLYLTGVDEHHTETPSSAPVPRPAKTHGSIRASVHYSVSCLIAAWSILSSAGKTATLSAGCMDCRSGRFFSAKACSTPSPMHPKPPSLVWLPA